MSGVIKYYYHSATSNPRTTMHDALACVGQALIRLYPKLYTSEDSLAYKLTNARIMVHAKGHGWYVEFATAAQATEAAKTAFVYEERRAKKKTGDT